MIIHDQLHREIKILKPLRRIVSLVPSQTELLVDLGLEENLVGITKFCVHPIHLRKTISVVGGTKKVKIDKIKALKPDIILCNKEENTQEMVRELENVAPVHVSDIIEISDALELIEMYGDLFNKKQEAQVLVKGIESKLMIFTALPKRKLRVAYFIWRDPWMVAGKNTFINTLLELNNWENIFAERDERYPVIEPEELTSANVDLILLSSEPFPFSEIHKKEIQHFCKCRITFANGEYFSWYGSRLLQAIDYFGHFQKQLSSSL
ncbi:ABC transporter substrate-binding protein [Antarcticibacterium arcticum]|uniref:ABC transporter substrate-binding protein n=1 Tax=Antarcticibacterium arcticum TaxID=2585771 RepID=A0A5B8YKU8_9FLAO|nr:helical backbone metal receptor [Antarcticibacterium arcticum]QED37838.1 ABC transporter substrate-binding protein [Antarcticibacterium arcticum]